MLEIRKLHIVHIFWKSFLSLSNHEWYWNNSLIKCRLENRRIHTTTRIYAYRYTHWIKYTWWYIVKMLAIVQRTSSITFIGLTDRHLPRERRRISSLFFNVFSKRGCDIESEFYCYVCYCIFVVFIFVVFIFF